MATAAGVDKESVEVLRGAVRWFLAIEESRTGSLTARASGLAGFVGLAVPLAGVLAQALPAHGWQRDLAVGLAVPGFLSLLAAIAVAVHGVLIPSSALAIDLAEVERYPTHEFIRQQPLMLEGRFLRGEVQTLAVERRRNDRKAVALRQAYIALTIALAFVMSQGILLAASHT